MLKMMMQYYECDVEDDEGDEEMWGN